MGEGDTEERKRGREERWERNEWRGKKGKGMRETAKMGEEDTEEGE